MKVKKVAKSGGKQRIDKEINSQLIKEAYLNLAHKLKRAPTHQEISNEVGISDTAIKNHLKNLKFDININAAKLLTEEVVLSVFNAAKKGNAASQRLWFQFVESWIEKNEIGFDKDTIDKITIEVIKK